MLPDRTTTVILITSTIVVMGIWETLPMFRVTFQAFAWML